MRITTNMMMRGYQNSLSDTMGGLSSARQKALSQRKYSKVSEDPFSAASASVLERRYLRNKDYLDTIEELQSKQDTQEDAVAQLVTLAKTIDKEYSTTGMNDPGGIDARRSLAATLREMERSMVSSLNAQYGDEFVLAGSDGRNIPFQLSDDGKTLTYRGYDVNSDDATVQAALQKLSKDTNFVDLGFGLTFNDANEVVASSAYNASLPGINLVGFGKTDEGISKNIIVLAGQMADELEKTDFDREAFGELWTQFHDGYSNLVDQEAQLGTKSALLESTSTRLTDLDMTMHEQLDSLENADPAEAIMNYSWAQYVYNCALKVGSSILTPSLLDFMK